MKKYNKYIVIIISMLFISCNGKEAKEILPFYFDNNKWGFINENYETVINPIYDDVTNSLDGKAVVMKGNLCGLINKNNEILMPVIYDIIVIFNEKLAVGMINHKSYIYNISDNSIIKIDYETAALWNNKVLIMSDSNQKVCLYNLEKKKLLKTEYDDIVVPRVSINFGHIGFNYVSNLLNNNPYINKDIAITVKNKKMGYININGSEICKPIYDHAFIFQSGKGIIIDNKKWGIINKEGKLIVEPKYQSIHFNENYYINAEQRENKNVRGSYVQSESFESNYVNHGYIVVKNNNHYGLIDTNGIEIIEPRIFKNKSIKFFGKYGFYRLNDEKTTKVFNVNSQVINTFDNCWYYNDTCFWFDKGANFGMVNIAGKILWQKSGVIRYPIVNAVIAMIDNKHCIIDPNGKFIEKPFFEKWVFPLVDRNNDYHFSFRNKDSLICFDAYGKRLFKLNEDIIVDYWCYPDSLFVLITEDYKYGVINRNGDIIIPPVYNGLSHLNKEFYKVYTDDRYHNSKYSDLKEARPFYVQATTKKRSKRIMSDPGLKMKTLRQYFAHSILIDYND